MGAGPEFGCGPGSVCSVSNDSTTCPIPFRQIPCCLHQPELVSGACCDGSSDRCRMGGGAGIPLRTVDTDLSVSGCPWWGERCNFVGVWETAELSSAKPGLYTKGQGV